MDYLYGVSHDIVKPGSGATALKSFKSGYIISFSDVLRVYDQHLGLKLQIEHIKRHAECYITAIVVNNAEDNLYVGYSDGYLCKYQLPGGLLIKHRTIPFRVKGMIFHENEDVIILWGSYCELWFLDSRSLEKTQGFCVNDWPIAVPFVNGKILSITKSGQINEYMFEKADVKGAVIQRSINNESSLNLLLSDGIIKINDPVVDVKRVGEFSWVLAQRHGWILLRWQNDELIQEISSGSTSEIQEVIESDEVDCFGVLEENDKLVWVSKGQVVPIDPVWNKEARLIGIICQVDCLLALVEDNNMVFYSCDLNNSFEWTTTGRLVYLMTKKDLNNKCVF